MGATCSVPMGFDLTDKERKKCVVLASNARELSKLSKLGVEALAAELVVHVRPIGKKMGKSDPSKSIPDKSDPSAAAAGQVSRALRAAILTQGTVQIEALRGTFGASCCPGLLLYDPVNFYPNFLFALRDLQVIRLDSSRDLMVVAAKNVDGDMEIAMYQTPEPSRFLQPLSEALVAAYAGVPDWAVPIQWNLGFTLPEVSSCAFKAFLGSDGGFSSSFLAATIAVMIRSHLPVRSLKQGSAYITGLLSHQQPTSPIPCQDPQYIDVVELVNVLPGGSSSAIRLSLILEALNCLPFNLVFRTLVLKNVVFPIEQQLNKFGQSLARILLYNITLREVNLSGTKLEGLGEELGQALAMNIQPLISRFDLSDCQLSDRDFRGLIPGLARLWCGGSAWPELVKFANNPNVSVSSWDLLFGTLVDPSNLPFWPSSPPPPPSLGYLQHLDILGTSAPGRGLARLVSRLSGLRSLSIGSCGSMNAGGMDLVLEALVNLDAPLEAFVGKNMNISCSAALFRHCDTLKSVTFIHFHGDATPLLCSWPKPVPDLSVEFKGNLDGAYAFAPDGDGSAPSGLTLRDNRNFGENAIKSLSVQATGLKSVYIYGMHYTEVADAVPMFACCGLATLHIYPKEGVSHRPGPEANLKRTTFWSVLATSTTLEDLQIPNQLSNNTGELVMIGGFLKANRSVRRINFDGSGFSLDVEGVKTLRSAFYGNKKVIAMKFPRAAHARTVEESKQVTEAELREVRACKMRIKQIFKQHYSKYNRNWRDKPNRLKLPYVERIRVAKRKIGSIERDMAKIARLLDEINQCIAANQMGYDLIQREKEQVRLERREGQLKNIAQKKQKVMTTLVRKLHEAKQRGRTGKSGKNQIPRSAYYKDRRFWPVRCAGQQKNGPSSHYRSLNDPYSTRFHWQYGFYSSHYHNARHDYYNRHIDMDCFPPISEEERPPISEEEAQPGDGSEEPENDEDVDDEQRNPPGEEGLPARDEESLPLCALDNDVALAGFPDSTGGTEDNVWECLVPSDENSPSPVPLDPWDKMDGLVQNADSNLDVVLTPEYLSEVHMEASELGPDVVADLAPVLDAGAAVDAKIDAVADSMAVDKSLVNGVIDSVVDENFDLGELQNDIGEIAEYENLAEEDDAAEYLVEADGVVEMYAGAGPRDLDDGGPSYGDASNAALAGARRTARTRKVNTISRRIRASVASRCSVEYRSLALPNVGSIRGRGVSSSFEPWPNDLVDTLMQEVTAAQIDAMAKSNLFSLPDVANDDPIRIMEWSTSCNYNSSFMMPVEVILVTQCSLDRLPNLREQLAAWQGKASVAVHVKHCESLKDAKKAIISCVNESKRRALECGGGASHWDVAVTVVQGASGDELYPINFLRNSALLEARYQQLKSRGVTDRSAAFLVDVDFRPSQKLHKMLHCEAAAGAILEQRRVVVCAAFEDASTLEGGALPQSMSELKRNVDNGQAEGFHLSHFPQGHGPTCFDQFWSATLDAATDDDLWKTSYDVPYQKFFEPYVVMAIDSVPLYDERFQGYGLNKVSHLASIARQTSKDFLVLPGVFLVAPVHKRSESWAHIYGSKSDEAKFNKLWLKGLYQNFSLRLEEGKGPAVSERTKKWHKDLVAETKALTGEIGGKEQLAPHALSMIPCANEELLRLVLCALIQQSIASTERGSLLVGDPCWRAKGRLCPELRLTQT